MTQQLGNSGMADELTEIYRAASIEQAYLLKDLLEQQGIQAVVSNPGLEGLSEVGIVGWTALPHVAVAAPEAEAARRIAVQFDETVSGEPELAAAAEAAVEAGDEGDFWPRCPQCDARRMTRCPICQTAGTDFPRADPPFAGPVGAADDAEPHSCGCGSGGCSTHGRRHEPAAAADGNPPDEDDAEETDAETEPEVPEPMLICTTCDEPFVPEYPRRCEWCGHEFGDGYEVHQIEEGEALEPVTGRVIAAIVAIIVLGAVLLGYFRYIM